MSPPSEILHEHMSEVYRAYGLLKDAQTGQLSLIRQHRIRRIIFLRKFILDCILTHHW